MEENNKNSTIDRDEFYWQNDPILSRFSFEFTKKIKTNPMYSQIYLMLLHGVDEYRIIEELLKMNEKYCNDLIRINEEQRPKYFIRKDNERKF